MSRVKWIFVYLRKKILIAAILIFIIYKGMESIIKDEIYSKYIIQETHSFGYFQVTNSSCSSKDDVLRIDWHNYTQIKYEQQRTGLGEQGEAASLSKEEQELEIVIFSRNGYNGALSDKIALNRSLPDVRHLDCKRKKYLKSLPSVSVIVPFYNEHLSTLLRTVYSVLNRSPEDLIKEFFLVDDASSEGFLKGRLEDYLKKHLPKIKLLRQKTRTGLVGARLTGAKAATGDVLVIMDAQIEANVNWLPPLLEQIALDNRVVVVPCIDKIESDTLKYQKTDDGRRGVFDWDLWYRRLLVPPNIFEKLPDPFETPIMAGSVMAISRKFFWELGGFDPGIKIWGAEHFELSFKIWQCGGRLVEVPCSRVGHIGRMVMPSLFDHNYTDFTAKNNRRVAEVWMDEYAQYLYARRPDWRTIDPGDLTEQKALRKKLNCKPFKWFMTQVAYDLPQNFPMVMPKPYAEGQIHPMSNPKMCVDGYEGRVGERFVVTPCNGSSEQIFQLSWQQDIIMTRKNEKWNRDVVYFCWDVPESYGAVRIFPCHSGGGNQQWRFLEDMKILKHKSGGCLEYNEETMDIFVTQCVSMAKTQQWIIDTINTEQLAQWEDRDSRATKLTGPVEKWEE